MICHLSHLILPSSAQDGEGTPVDVQVKDNGNGTYSCSYTPRKPVKHTAMISWGGVNIPDSPFRVCTQTSLCSFNQAHVIKKTWAAIIFCYRWILEQAVTPTRWRCQDLAWPKLASRPSSQPTSLLTAQRLAKVDLHKSAPCFQSVNHIFYHCMILYECLYRSALYLLVVRQPWFVLASFSPLFLSSWLIVKLKFLERS